jgi:hypothetical protein
MDRSSNPVNWVFWEVVESWHGASLARGQRFVAPKGRAGVLKAIGEHGELVKVLDAGGLDFVGF